VWAAPTTGYRIELLTTKRALHAPSGGSEPVDESMTCVWTPTGPPNTLAEAGVLPLEPLDGLLGLKTRVLDIGLAMVGRLVA